MWRESNPIVDEYAKAEVVLYECRQGPLSLASYPDPTKDTTIVKRIERLRDKMLAPRGMSVHVERKWDGVRVRITKDHRGRVSILSKNFAIENTSLIELLMRELEFVPIMTRLDAELVAVVEEAKDGEELVETAEDGSESGNTTEDEREGGRSARRAEPLPPCGDAFEELGASASLSVLRGSGGQWKLCVFDCACYHGRTLYDVSLNVRKALLWSMRRFQPAGAPSHVRWVVPGTPDVFVHRVVSAGRYEAYEQDVKFRAFVERNMGSPMSEGFIVRAENDKYLPPEKNGKREKRSEWSFKYKPEHTGKFDRYCIVTQSTDPVRADERWLWLPKDPGFNAGDKIKLSEWSIIGSYDSAPDDDVAYASVQKVKNEVTRALRGHGTKVYAIASSQDEALDRDPRASWTWDEDQSAAKTYCRPVAFVTIRFDVRPHSGGMMRFARPKEFFKSALHFNGWIRTKGALLQELDDRNGIVAALLGPALPKPATPVAVPRREEIRQPSIADVAKRKKEYERLLKNILTWAREPFNAGELEKKMQALKNSLNYEKSKASIH
jgi:hypothetical protein